MTRAAAIEPEPDAAAGAFGTRVDLARRFVQILAGDGVLRGLIGPREATRLWTRHLLNCAVIAPLLAPRAVAVDIGSGAGLPGVVLAIARPDCAVTLVEPLLRRTTFLDGVVAELGLTNCTVVRGRADQVVDVCGGADVVTSRAVAPLARLAGWSALLLRPGGELLALKGSSAVDELTRDRAAAESAGLADLRVVEVGVGVVEPPTILIRGVRTTPVRRRPPSHTQYRPHG